MEQSVRTGSKGVVFEIDLPAGPTELMTYLEDENGKAGGAYFTQVEALNLEALHHVASRQVGAKRRYDGRR